MECDKRKMQWSVMISDNKRSRQLILMLMLDAMEFSLFPLCYLPNISLDLTASPIEIASPYSNLTYFTGNLSQEIKLLQICSKGFWIKLDEGKAINYNCSDCQSRNGICVIVKMELIPRIAYPVGAFCNI